MDQVNEAHQLVEAGLTPEAPTPNKHSNVTSSPVV